MNKQLCLNNTKTTTVLAATEVAAKREKKTNAREREKKRKGQGTAGRRSLERVRVVSLSSTWVQWVDHGPRTDKVPSYCSSSHFFFPIMTTTATGDREQFKMEE